MIKVPATPAGLGALEELAAAGVTLNCTLIFSERQYRAAREAIWRGAQRRKSLDGFKSVYSIFVSRLDVYTAEQVPELSPAAQGMVGIVNAKRLWQLNQQFWADKKVPLQQEIIFASTGTKKPEDAPWKYVEAFAGSDIETNPPATNARVQQSGRTFPRQVGASSGFSVVARTVAARVAGLGNAKMRRARGAGSKPFVKWVSVPDASKTKGRRPSGSSVLRRTSSGSPVAYIADCHSTPESGVPIGFASITPTTALSTYSK